MQMCTGQVMGKVEKPVLDGLSTTRAPRDREPVLAAALQSTGTEPPCDPQVIAELCAAIGDLSPVIEAAHADLPGRLAALRNALAGGETGTVRALAHSLAGAYGNLGAGECTRLARALEDRGRTDDLTDVPELLAALEAETGRLLAALGALLGSAI
jgi:HPt (histidine-containing phosphotransfer) domain-containing protein